MDFVFLAYIHYIYEFDIPFVCGDEALFQLNIISYLIQQSGGFKLTEDYQKNEMYKAVLHGYINSLLKNNQVIEIFLEREKSKSGKIQRPTECLFDFIIQDFIQRRVANDPNQKDIKIVPVSINYDRVHEGESFPLELLGEQPHKENLLKLMWQLSFALRNHGRVEI